MNQHDRDNLEAWARHYGFDDPEEFLAYSMTEFHAALGWQPLKENEEMDSEPIKNMDEERFNAGRISNLELDELRSEARKLGQQYELIKARRWAQVWKQAAKLHRERNNMMSCAYCGWEAPKNVEVMLAHMMTCEARPDREDWALLEQAINEYDREQEIERLRLRVKELEGMLFCPNCEGNNIYGHSPECYDKRREVK